MARFFCAAWPGENLLSFDLIDATKQRGEKEHQTVLEWLAKPELPPAETNQARHSDYDTN